ncbi:MAG: hypothetical protein RMJ83_07875 [Armatimonadota bacterium]|nr:hypothetical protein [Armatimonadota bacterium]
MRTILGAPAVLLQSDTPTYWEFRADFAPILGLCGGKALDKAYLVC